MSRGQTFSASPTTTASTWPRASPGSMEAWMPPITTGTPLSLKQAAIS